MRVTADPRDAQEIALEAYLYFYPLLSMDVTRRVMTNVEAGKPVPLGFGHANSFSHMREYPAGPARAHTFYSLAWLDLREEPIVLTLPDMQGRDYVLPLLDMWTNVFASPGTQTTGTQGRRFAVLAPGWSGDLPAQIDRIDAPTAYVWTIGRTQANGTSDDQAVHDLLDRYAIAPLSRLDTVWSPPVPAFDAAVDMKTPPKAQVDGLKPGAYFRYAAELFKAHPPQAADWSTVERLRRIGIERGHSFDIDTLADNIRSAIEKGAAEARKLMARKAPSLGQGGWQLNTESINASANYYLKRAIIAQVGLGADGKNAAHFERA